ncbi:hypothetical protein [Archangium sp.]|nr:hypothetical protein [Archangium sp.]HYO51434.1 hypothetical protein [Archangium sp.]
MKPINQPVQISINKPARQHLDALAVELTESPAPEVKPIGSAAGAN